jgi:hypothetical protein
MDHDYQDHGGSGGGIKGGVLKIILFPFTLLMWFLGLFAGLFRGGKSDGEQRQGLLGGSRQDDEV